MKIIKFILPLIFLSGCVNVPLKDSPEKENIEEKVNFLGVEVESLKGKIDKIERILKDNEERQEKEKERIIKYFELKFSDFESRLNTLKESQKEFYSIIDQFNKSFNLINQNLLKLQESIIKIQQNQKDLKNWIEKRIMEEKLITSKEIQNITDSKIKVFVEELAKQAGKIAKIEESVKSMEKNIKENFKKIVEELTNHESQIIHIENEIKKDMASFKKSVDSAIEGVYSDVNSQLKKNFSVILSELSKHESSICNLEKRTSSIEDIFKYRPEIVKTGENLEYLLEEEKKRLEEEYKRELEKRLLFYAKIKNLLDEISKYESQLAIYKAKIKLFESINLDTSLSPFKFYIVKKGDTLWKIARDFNTSVDYLKRLNGLDTDLIIVGQTLKVPVK